MPATFENIREMRKARAAIVDQAQEIVRSAENEGRDLTRDEKERFDQLVNDAHSRSETIEREERMMELQTAHSPQQWRSVGDGADYPSLESRDAFHSADVRNSPQYAKAFGGWLRNGADGLTTELRYALRQGYFEGAETRALGGGTNTAGGYTVPQDFYRRVEKAMKAFGGVRTSGATIIPTSNGRDLPMPTNDDTGNTGAIVTENTQITEQDTTFGQSVLGAYMYTSKIIRVSLQLLEDNAVDVEQYLAEIIAERIWRAANAHFTTGTGTGQPEGVLTGATLGHTAAGTAAVTYDELVELEHSVDRAYRGKPSTRWMLNDATLKHIKQLKDNDGNPLWSSGIAERQPETILGYRYVVNNDMPDLGAGEKPILFGDFSKYHIRDVIGMRVIRFDEKYMDYLQKGFLAFMRMDGLLLDAGQGPIKYLQNAAS